MTEPTDEDIREALERLAHHGEVFPTSVRAAGAREHWSGRRWDVLQVIAQDVERMRYVAGGDRPDEVATCAGRWADSTLEVDDIDLVIRSGGYDPDPFVTLANAGLLRTALLHDDGTIRHIHGERAGVWISDELALAAPDDTLARTRQMIQESTPAPTSPG